MNSSTDNVNLTAAIKAEGLALGFQDVGVADIDLGEHGGHLDRWLAAGFHGELDYMANHGTKRSRPEELVPGTIRVLTVRMDYLPPNVRAKELLDEPDKAYLSRYALGRDYHKVMRKRLQKLARVMETQVEGTQYRVFVDSAPVLEKALAEKSGLGWIGKHTLLISKAVGSWFFLGEIYTDIPLVVDAPVKAHCGDCRSCIDVCPTQAIISPYKLDARKCISYLTIEIKGAIPIEFRRPMGNRVFGCDDCQIFCPWTRFAPDSQEDDFKPRHGLDEAGLLELFLWDEQTFESRTLGSPIRRTGYEGWQRNLSVGLGNAPYDAEIVAALKARLAKSSAMVAEHIRWAIAEQLLKSH